MHKAIPPRMVEPYLTGRRSIISGFVHRVADTRASTPRDLHRLSASATRARTSARTWPRSMCSRWRAVGTERYQVPYSAEHGGDWAMQPPFTGTGFTAGQDQAVAEYFTDPIPVPVGAEIHRIGT